MKDVPKTPEAFNRVVDKVLSYKPKPKTEAAKKRKNSTDSIAKKRTRSGG